MGAHSGPWPTRTVAHSTQWKPADSNAIDWRLMVKLPKSHSSGLPLGRVPYGVSGPEANPRSDSRKSAEQEHHLREAAHARWAPSMTTPWRARTTCGLPSPLLSNFGQVHEIAGGAPGARANDWAGGNLVELWDNVVVWDELFPPSSQTTTGRDSLQTRGVDGGGTPHKTPLHGASS